MNKRLTRSVKDKVIGGVAGGIAEYFEIDPVIVRVLFVVSLFFHGAGFIAYIVLWIALPEANYALESSSITNVQNSNSSESQMKQDDAASAYFKRLEEKKIKRNRNLGIVLLVLGCIFLADNFIPKIRIADFWPIILIALGLSMLLKAKKS